MDSPHTDPPDSCPHVRVIKKLVIEHYEKLHKIASREMHKEQPNHSLGATGLVNEVVCQLLRPEKNISFKDTNHFLATATLMMRHTLIDRARGKQAEKAGGQLQRQELHSDAADEQNNLIDMLIIREELERLGKLDPDAAKVVMLHCEGHSIEEIAGILGISRTAAYERWNFGRAWLLRLFQTPNE
jgi:RNA polymerase sigma factor (TIGR02999 family)